MPSRAAIMNMAMDLLDEEPIVSPTDNRKAARFLNRNYEAVRDALLRRHPWNFAMTRASLPAEVTAPAFEWSYSYVLPPDCLRVLPLTTDGTANGYPRSHIVEGRRILTSQSGPLKFRYIRQVTDENEFDAMFVQALAGTLAYRGAMLITGKQSYAAAAQQFAAQAVQDAQMVDALEGTPEEPLGDDWVNGRSTGVMPEYS